MPRYSAAFIKEMPKSDLHLHLDGSLRLESLTGMARRSGTKLPSDTVAGLKELVFKDKYQNLGEYLHCFQYTCAVLRDMENLQQAAYELAQDNQAEGVNYIEVRFAPQLLTDVSQGIDVDRVLHAVNNGLKQAQQEYNRSEAVLTGEKPPFAYGIINCAMRMFGDKGFSPYYTNLFQLMRDFEPIEVIRLAAMELVRASVRLRDEEGIPIVGLDLAGQEAGYPAGKFKEVYEYAHQHFLLKTLHAGEAYGAESVFEAITECYADRIGHGYSMFIPEMIQDPAIRNRQQYIRDLASYIADKRIAIEVCLTSNLQTNPAITDIRQHKFKDMLESRIATVICTDNRLVSDTTVSKEYQLALDNFDIPLKRLKDM
ncbi:adenosine deaminase family protein, partial [Chromatiaceae bacterium AAb-1]|nr:adenosine deaminase family protein [Chromatiaceae bacterium AAb-1]